MLEEIVAAFVLAAFDILSAVGREVNIRININMLLEQETTLQLIYIDHDFIFK